MNANEREYNTNTNANANEQEHLNYLFRETVGAVYEVANVLGAGFLEKVYERALVRGLKARGLEVEAQVQIHVVYKGEIIGEYFADVLVDGKLIVELKCADRLSSEHMAQCMNYLRATNRALALLVNFQNSKVEWKRIVYNF